MSYGCDPYGKHEMEDLRDRLTQAETQLERANNLLWHTYRMLGIVDHPHRYADLRKDIERHLKEAAKSE